MGAIRALPRGLSVHLSQIETETTKDGNMEEEDWWKLLEGDRYVGDWKAPWSKEGDDEDEDEEDEEDVSASIDLVIKVELRT